MWADWRALVASADWRALVASADWVGGLAAAALLLVLLGWLD